MPICISHLCDRSRSPPVFAPRPTREADPPISLGQSRSNRRRPPEKSNRPPFPSARRERRTVAFFRPLTVTRDWSEQSIVAAPDPKLWICLRARHDRARTYGELDLATVLRDVNANIVLILFPLDVAPMGPIEGDPHKLRAGKDYPVWRGRLPEGYVMLNQVQIDFKGH